jgi:hypothetical protein
MAWQMGAQRAQRDGWNHQTKHVEFQVDITIYPDICGIKPFGIMWNNINKDHVEYVEFRKKTLCSEGNEWMLLKPLVKSEWFRIKKGHIRSYKHNLYPFTPLKLFWEMLRTFDFRSNPLEQVQKEVAR